MPSAERRRSAQGVVAFPTHSELEDAVFDMVVAGRAGGWCDLLLPM